MEPRIPQENRSDTLFDSLGFDKKYLVPPGGSIPIGESIYDIPGLDLNSPSGRLLAKENGWTPKGSFYRTK